MERALFLRKASRSPVRFWTDHKRAMRMAIDSLSHSSGISVVPDDRRVARTFMANESKCLKCGAPLNRDARDGVCPKCLLGQALADDVQGRLPENRNHETY